MTSLFPVLHHQVWYIILMNDVKETQVAEVNVAPAPAFDEARPVRPMTAAEWKQRIGDIVEARRAARRR